MDSVVKFGPPPVVVKIRSNTCKDPISRVMRTNTAVGLISGNVMPFCIYYAHHDFPILENVYEGKYLILNSTGG